MKGVKHCISYKETGYFAPLILDYLSKQPATRSLYAHFPDVGGLSAALAARAAFPVDRLLLVEHLHAQYQQVAALPSTTDAIEALLAENCFTVCTAHQPALFTGHLYFIYKIIHAIKLAKTLNEQHRDKKFVPVFWMGSEDADLEELGSFYLGKEKLQWHAGQKGAVGKMKTSGLAALIRRIEGELGVLPHGRELVDLLEQCYLNKPDIQTATFAFIHALFGAYGLVVIIPDAGPLKQKMRHVFADDMFRHIPTRLVEKTIAQLSLTYRIQAQPRPINVFYFTEGVRNRIENDQPDIYRVADTDIQFTKETLQQELDAYPERFSPNVILRGLFQEMILPNLCFIGGGGEMAYWLELKALFDHYQVPFPVLVLRNSYTWVPAPISRKMVKLGLHPSDLFLTEQSLLNRFAMEAYGDRLSIGQEMETLARAYQVLQEKAAAADHTLSDHVQALFVQSEKKLIELSKKMLRAERKKNKVQQEQVQQIRETLFPLGSLQERVENFMPYYARYGKSFLDLILEHALSIEQEFTVLQVQE